jgi:hypothetical protein
LEERPLDFLANLSLRRRRSDLSVFFGTHRGGKNNKGAIRGLLQSSSNSHTSFEIRVAADVDPRVVVTCCELGAKGTSAAKSTEGGYGHASGIAETGVAIGARPELGGVTALAPDVPLEGSTGCINVKAWASGKVIASRTGPRLNLAGNDTHRRSKAQLAPTKVSGPACGPT